MRPVNAGFTWHDGERVIRFGRGALADAPALLDDGYALLTTQRARRAAPALAERAAAVHDVRTGDVGEVAAELRAAVSGRLLVALGGGRVIDVAKALAAAAGPPVRAAAMPTTLSAAEMTSAHRQAAGAPADTPQVRPAVVINDPALSASQPPAERAASCANALAHALEAPCSGAAGPVPVLAAQEATRLLAGDPHDDDALALGALLAGYAMDATGYGLHHVLSQTLRAVTGIGHGPANAAMLPHTAAALRRRAPEAVGRIDDAAGRPVEELAVELAHRAGTTRLRDLGVTEADLDAAADAAVRRPQLAVTPPAADRAELRSLLAAAW
jgi:alcohol dehydrogenase class IV